MRAVTILGSTGSIGQSTLDVIRRRQDRFSVHALVAGRNLDRLAEQIVEFRPAVAVIETESDLTHLRDRIAALGLERARWPDFGFGAAARVEVATAVEVDFVLSAIVGVAGLEATYEAVRARKQIGLANKETLVAGGALVMKAARENGVELIPVDSEHNGAHQCLRAGRRGEVTRLILTASGGPFRNTPKQALQSVTPEQALNHPTWKMGPRITIDSATMMNKGFEVIEACWLFDMTPAEVDVVVHPQSSVHAMVEYNDGSVVAQLSTTDMRMPIQYALTYPERWDSPAAKLDLTAALDLEFEPPDTDRFPALELGYEVARAGGTAGAVVNAANEAAVAGFLEGQLSFTEIVPACRAVLGQHNYNPHPTLTELLQLDAWARKEITRWVCT